MMLPPGTDRLSDLPDGVLGAILSCLPTKEAARAAVLSRQLQWRRAFADVEAISFVDHEPPIYGYYDDCTFRLESSEQRSRNGDLIDDVNAALLCRRRCAGHRDTGPPSSFRVHLGRYDSWDEAMMSQWLRYLLKPRKGTGQEVLEVLVHLDLRLQATVLGEHLVGEPEPLRRRDDADGECPARIPYIEDPYTTRLHRYMPPTSLFSRAALRTLCLGGFVLDLPELIHLPLVDTLVLSSFSHPVCGYRIQRLISACPRLVDLTLERCGYKEKRNHYTNPEDLRADRSYTISVLDKHLRSLAIRWCHNLVRLSVDASELRTLEYRGANKMSSCTLGFCGRKVYEQEPKRLRKFLEQFTATKHLHLVSTHLGEGIETSFTTGLFPSFPNLERLELTGYLQMGSIEALTRMLEQAPGIQVLSLHMKTTYDESVRNVWVPPQDLGDEIVVPDVSIPCLRNQVREINLVLYQGHKAHRTVAKLLLCNAMVLERVCVGFPKGSRELQTRLQNEIEGWVLNRSVNTIFF